VTTKFHGDWPRELGDPALKKKHLGQNISPSGIDVPGGLMRTAMLMMTSEL